MSNKCPFSHEIDRPAITVASRATILVDAMVNKSPGEVIVPSWPEEVLENMTEAQRTKLDLDATRAADFAYFAVYAAQHEDALRVAVPSAPNIQPKRAQAIGQYFSKLEILGGEFRENSDYLSTIRGYGARLQEEVPRKQHSAGDLEAAYNEAGLPTLRTTITDLDLQYNKFSYLFKSSAPDVLRNSMPTMRALAGYHNLAVVDYLIRENSRSDAVEHLRVPVIDEKDGTESIGLDMSALRKLLGKQSRLSKYMSKRKFGERTRNACPALAAVGIIAVPGAVEMPVRVKALESLYIQGINIMESDGVWPINVPDSVTRSGMGQLQAVA